MPQPEHCGRARLYLIECSGRRNEAKRQDNVEVDPQTLKVKKIEIDRQSIHHSQEQMRPSLVLAGILTAAACSGHAYPRASLPV
jgi:hypothetical protein